MLWPRQCYSSSGAGAGGCGRSGRCGVAPAGPHESCCLMLQDVFVKNACTTACKVSDQYVASFTLSLARCTAPCHTRSPRSPRLPRLACLPLLPRSHRCFPTFSHMFRSVSGLSASALPYVRAIVAQSRWTTTPPTSSLPSLWRFATAPSAPLLYRSHLLCICMFNVQCHGLHRICLRSFFAAFPLAHTFFSSVNKLKLLLFHERNT
jgi:hypothetical protein